MKKMILNYLEKTGKKSEFDLFRNTFQSIPKTKFAVIKISGKTLENKIDLIAEDIAFLNKLGIYPIIIHGAGSTLDRKLPQSKKIEGIRVTEESDMDIIKKVYADISNDIKEKINSHGGKAEIADNIFDTEPISTYGHVGKITGIETQKIKDIINKNAVPIISPIGKYADTYHNINADTAAKELVKKISPKKFLLITETGGILDEKDQLIRFINLSNIDEINHITGGMLLKVQEIKELLKTTKDCAVVITSAENILKELFTIIGSGTYLKYHTIHSTTIVTKEQQTKLKTLLEKAFEKKLTNDYFEENILELFHEKDFDGIAIIKTVNKIPYLDKFTVKKQYHGTGLGKSIWNAVTKKYPKLILRASPKNPINSFYAKNCVGMIKKSGWNIYWNNLTDEELLPAVNAVASKKKTMI